MKNSTLKNLPDEKGYFGSYGGGFVPPELEIPLQEIEKEYKIAKEKGKKEKGVKEKGVRNLCLGKIAC